MNVCFFDASSISAIVLAGNAGEATMACGASRKMPTFLKSFSVSNGRALRTAGLMVKLPAVCPSVYPSGLDLPT